MSAVVLRRAATLMRERATAAIREGVRDLWADMATMDPDNNGWIVCEQRQPDVDWDTTVAVLPYDYEGDTARHVASWHPVVALAVADWLENAADCMEPRFSAIGLVHKRHALAVAYAYLGEPEESLGQPLDGCNTEEGMTRTAGEHKALLLLLLENVHIGVSNGDIVVEDCVIPAPASLRVALVELMDEAAS